MNLSRLLLLMLLSLSTYGIPLVSEGNSFNLNIDNGLPTNHVYATITDRHGYLWIATASGVVRYNGYELKVFTTEDGLPINDVWQLVEDNKGRIWLGCIANKLGYIYNDQYYNATFASNSNYTIYPRYMKLNAGHISFFSTYAANSIQQSYYIERNDTVFKYELVNALKKYNPNLALISPSFGEIINAMTNEEGKTIVIYQNNIYHYKITENKINIIQKTHVEGINFDEAIGYNSGIYLDKYIIFFYYNYKNFFKLVDGNTGTIAVVNLKDIGVDENITHIYHNADRPELGKHLFVYTHNYIVQYTINNGAQYVNTVPIQTKLFASPLDGNPFNSYVHDNFWGEIITTKNEGLVINYDKKENLKKCPDINLTGYRFIKGDSEHSFWVNDSNIICIIDKALKAKKIDLNGEPDILYRAVRKDKLNFYFTGKNCYEYNLASERAKKLPPTVAGSSAFNMIIDPKGFKYCIGNSGFYIHSPDTTVKQRLDVDFDRFRDIIYDSARNSYWAYNNNRILVYRQGKKTIYSQSELSQFGVERAEKICIDNTYGNFFFKGNEKLTLYDPDKKKYIELYAFLNLKESTISLLGDILIVYGTSGIMFSRIIGRQKLSDPIFYQNIKNYRYKFIYDAQISFGKIILSTDKGVYYLNIPTVYNSSNAASHTFTPYRFTGYYLNKLFNINNNDTIALNQEELRLQFDLINPCGNGSVKYLVNNQDSTLALNANEYNIPAQYQTPGSYYQITLSAYDKVWRSNNIHLTIYIEPLWWQTAKMKLLIWISVSIIIILLFTLAILITRRMVLNASKKRNMRMEMELKAIYSQINPHFIFNSLNSALLLVSKNRMDEAYTHISKFSKLLRSYIKSSRNKFISVEEEIINLQNYIELQQIRFKDRFSYDINTDNLSNRAIKIPSLLLQPFVENAIEHGLLNKKEKGHLTIEFLMPDLATLICTVSDDGIGREESRKISGHNLTKEESYGNLLVRDLVNIFNKYENVKVDIQYNDNKSTEAGTQVIVTIKYLKKVK